MQVDQKKIETYRETIQLQEKVIGKMQALTEARMGTKIKGDNLLDKLYASLEREKNGGLPPEEAFGDNLSDCGTQTDEKVGRNAATSPRVIESKNTATAMSPRPNLSPRPESVQQVSTGPSENEIALEKKVKRLELELQEQEEQVQTMKQRYQKQINELQEELATKGSPREGGILDDNEAMKKIYVLEAEIVSKEYRIKALEEQLQKTAENASKEVERMRFKLLTFDSSGLSDDDDIEESPRPVVKQEAKVIPSSKAASGSASKAVTSLREEKKTIEPIREVPDNKEMGREKDKEKEKEREREKEREKEKEREREKEKEKEKVNEKEKESRKNSKSDLVPPLKIQPDVYNTSDDVADDSDNESVKKSGGGKNPETEAPPPEAEKERILKLGLKDDKNDTTGQLTIAFAMFYQPSKKCYKFQIKRLNIGSLKPPSSRLSFTSPRLAPVIKFDFPPLGWTYSTEELSDIGGKNFSKFFPDDEQEVQFDCTMDHLQGDSMYISVINGADKKVIGKTKLTMF